MNYQTIEQQAEPTRHTNAPVTVTNDDHIASTTAGTTARELIETVLFILLIFFIFRGVVQNYRVQGQSMEPNFHTDQYLIVNKIIFFHFDLNAPLRLLPGLGNLPPDVIYPLRTPQRGDIVIVEEPVPEAEAEREEILIKRVIGLPGETVQIKDGVVRINGQPLREQQSDGGYLIEETNCYGGKLCEPYVVPAGHIVVMGDHRSNSLDSRSWGADPGLPLDRVIGKAWVSYWPRTEWGVIPMPAYSAATP